MSMINKEIGAFSAQAYIDVPCGCCATIAVQNTSDQPIEVQNANLIVVRVA